jgi:putative membrane protein
MKAIIRNIAIYTFALYVLPFIIPGVEISGGFWTLLIGGLALTLLFFVVKPILNVISIPVSVISVVIFSTITNLFVLYILTVFISGISITPFSYPHGEFLGFITPRLSFNTFFAYVYTAFILSFIDAFVSWLVKQ